MTNATTGKTTIAPEVIIAIARLNTLSVPGVSRLATVPVDVNRWFAGNPPEGVRLAVENKVVYMDLYVILEMNQNVREVSHAIQNRVSRAIEEMVGMEVGHINIHVEDIEFPTPGSQTSG